MEIRAKEYYAGALTYNEIIMRHFDRIASSGNDIKTFINNVGILDMLMTPFKEKDFDQKVAEKIEEAKEKSATGKLSDMDIASIRLQELTKLAQRSGFIPPKMVEGVLDAELIERVFAES